MLVKEEELGASYEKDLLVSFTEVTTKPSLSSMRLNLRTENEENSISLPYVKSSLSVYFYIFSLIV